MGLKADIAAQAYAATTRPRCELAHDREFNAAHSKYPSGDLFPFFFFPPRHHS